MDVTVNPQLGFVLFDYALQPAGEGWIQWVIPVLFGYRWRRR
jgi:hypothetical protein